MNANFNKYYLASRRIQCDDRWGSIRIRASREAKSKHSRTSADHRISRQRRDLGSSRSRPVFAHLHNVSSSRDEMQVDRIETTRTPTCRSSCCLLTCRRTCWSPRLRSHWDTRSSFAKLLQLRKCSTHVLVTWHLETMKKRKRRLVFDRLRENNDKRDRRLTFLDVFGNAWRICRLTDCSCRGRTERSRLLGHSFAHV